MKPELHLAPEVLLRAYAAGVFPMAEGANDGDVFWVDPHMRGILPLHGFHVPRRLRRTIRKRPFEVRVNTAFERVIAECAAPAPGRRSTWINHLIREAYTRLHERGHAHSVECWRDGELVGGLYGVSLGAAFFGESMFSRRRDASKVALVHLVARLKAGGFRLLDTQFVTEHLCRFGAVEVPRYEYHLLLDDAVHAAADFMAFDGDDDAEKVLALALARAVEKGDETSRGAMETPGRDGVKDGDGSSPYKRQ